jgi:hypothetical protein
MTTEFDDVMGEREMINGAAPEREVIDGIATHPDRPPQRTMSSGRHSRPALRKGDQGRASRNGLLDAWEGCQEVARACRRHAALLASLATEGQTRCGCQRSPRDD